MKIDEDNPWAVENIDEFLYFCCPECDVKNQSEDLFLIHALDHHPKAKEYIDNFKIKQEPYEEDNLDNEEFSNYAEPECDIKVEQEIGDQETILKQTVNDDEDDPLNVPEGQKNYKCKLCDKAFTKPGSVKIHIATVHEKQKNHKCDLCAKAFSVKQDLQRHIANVHEGQRNFPCHLCNKAFSQKSAIKTHIANVHERQKNHKCDMCGKAFSHKDHLKTHITTVHEGQKNHKCDLCGNAFSSKQYLRRHIGKLYENFDHESEITVPK